MNLDPAFRPIQELARYLFLTLARKIVFEIFKKFNRCWQRCLNMAKVLERFNNQFFHPRMTTDSAQFHLIHDMKWSRVPPIAIHWTNIFPYELIFNEAFAFIISTNAIAGLFFKIYYIDHRRWSKRCLLTRGYQTLKKTNYQAESCWSTLSIPLMYNLVL